MLVLSADAQGENFDPAAAKARYLGRSKPGLVEKTKLSSEVTDNVLEIRWKPSSKLRGIRDLSEDERKKKQEEATTEANTKYKTIPLTDA